MKVTDVASHLAQMKYDNHVVELDSGSEDEQLDGIPPVTEELQVDSCCCCCWYVLKPPSHDSERPSAGDSLCLHANHKCFQWLDTISIWYLENYLNMIPWKLSQYDNLETISIW